MIRHATKTRIVTPEQARDILAHNLFKDQRKVEGNHVSFLKTTMENGEFDGGSPIRFASFSNLAPVLIDGQHRLHAISLMPSDYKLQVTVITSRCDTPEEVAQIYARIDRGRSRSLVDALQALGYFSESNGLSRAQSAAVLACSPLFETHLRTISINGFSYASRSAEHRAEVMGPWMDASRQFYGAISKSNFGNSRLFYNRQVVVVGLATFKEPDAAERAEDFWQVMAEDSGLDALDPRKICLEFVRSQTGGGRGSATRRGQGRSHVVGYLAQGVTMCWNAYYRGQAEISRVQVRDPKGPLRILGTMYAKRDDREIPIALTPDAQPGSDQKDCSERTSRKSPAHNPSQAVA